MISKNQLQVDYKGPSLPEPVNIMIEWVCDVYEFYYDVNVYCSSETRHNNRRVASVPVHSGVILTSYSVSH